MTAVTGSSVAKVCNGCGLNAIQNIIIEVTVNDVHTLSSTTRPLVGQQPFEGKLQIFRTFPISTRPIQPLSTTCQQPVTPEEVVAEAVVGTAMATEVLPHVTPV